MTWMPFRTLHVGGGGNGSRTVSFESQEDLKRSLGLGNSPKHSIVDDKTALPPSSELYSRVGDIDNQCVAAEGGRESSRHSRRECIHEAKVDCYDSEEDVRAAQDDFQRLSISRGKSSEHGIDLCELKDIVGLVDFNGSVYDLTIQYSCMAVHPTLGSNGGMRTLIMVLFLQLLNLWLQVTMLVEVRNLITVPAMWKAKDLYNRFTEQCYGLDESEGGYVYSEQVLDNFHVWEEPSKWELCQLPLTSPNFYFLILLIWTFFLVYELKQSVQFAGHTLRLEKPHTGKVMFIELDGNFIISHMSNGLKAWICATVFAPRILIAVCLWIVGACWLTATSGFENLVLNALALTFITELDELIYRACTSESMKRCLEMTKLPLPAFSYAPTASGPCETLITCASCIGLTLIYIYYLQEAIPNYRWDLPEFCNGSGALMRFGRIR